MDTTFVSNFPKINIPDTVNAVLTNMPDKVQLSDDAMNVYDGIQSQLSASNAKMDSVYQLLQKTSSGGWGMEQIVAVVAIPLIIAIFAFSLPLILNAIWTMDAKYQSREISRILEYSWQTVLYLLSIIANAIILMVLLFAPSAQNVIAAILPYSTSALVISAILFYSAVRNFSNPYLVLRQLESRYMLEYILTYVRVKIRKRILLIYRFFNKENRSAVNIWDMILGLNEYNMHYKADKRYFERILALLRLAVSTNDITLFYTLKENLGKRVNEIKIRSLNDKTKYAPIYYKEADELFYFYRDAISLVGQCNEPTFQEGIIEGVGSIYSHSQLPVEFDNICILKALAQLKGDTGLNMVKNYLSRVNSIYRNISSMAIISNITGVDVEEKKDRERLCRQEWRWIKDMHYMFCAYWWAKNEYRIIPELCPVKTRMLPIDILPICSSDVLYQCLSTIDSIDSTRLTFPIGQVFAITTETMRDVVLKYTAFLLYYTARRTIVFNREPLDKGKRECMPKIMPLLNEMVTGLFIKHTLEQAQFDFAGIDIKVVLTRAYAEVTYHETHKAFERKIFNVRCDELRQRIAHCEQYAQTYATEGIYCGKAVKYTDENPLKEWTIALPKDHFIQSDNQGDRLYSLERKIGQDVLNRYMYVWLECMSQMKMRTKEWDLVECCQEIQKIAQNHQQQYVIVSIDSTFDTFLYPRPQGFIYQQISQHFFELGITTKLFRENHGMLYIIRKDDLPTLQYEDGYEQSDCDFMDESLREDGVLQVRVTINPHLVMRFNKNAKVLRIKCTKMNV